MKSKLKTLVLASTLAVAASGLSFGAANAQPQPPAHAAGISWSQLVNQLQNSGYSIEQIDKKRYGWKVDVRDNRGIKLELTLDTAGRVLQQEYD